MSVWSRIAYLFRGERLNREIDEELEAHLGEAIAQGRDPDEARLALGKTGGKLTTFEYDAERAATARANFQKAGVERLVTLVEGDAHQTVARLKEPVDIVFIDADKEGYIDYLNKLLPLVRPGGLILAHNSDIVPDYVRTITARADLETVFYGSSLAVTLKKR